MSINDPIPVSIPVKRFLNAIEERTLHGASQKQYYLLGIYMYCARFHEFIQHINCSDDSKRIMKDICRKMKWTNEKPIWEALTYQNVHEFISTDATKRLFEQHCTTVHTDLIKTGVLVLPGDPRTWILPVLSIYKTSESYCSQTNKGKKDKKRVLEDSCDPEKRSRKRSMTQMGIYEASRQRTDTTRHPLWKTLLRRFDHQSLLSFTSGSVEQCLFIKDHTQSHTTTKYRVTRNTANFSSSVVIEKLLRFYLISNVGFRTKKPTDNCRQLRSTNGCFLCLNPTHYI